MALKALLLRKKLDDAKKRLDTLKAKEDEFKTRETELSTAIEEMPVNADEETRNAVEESITAFEQEREDYNSQVTALEQEIEGLESELDAEETPPVGNPAGSSDDHNDNVTRKDERKMRITEARAKMFGNTVQERDQFFAREDIKNYLAEIRTCIKEKRALLNVGLTIPEVMLGVLRENVINYSKLYRHVTVRAVSGEGRALIMGTIPEAVWTDCCANLNELTLEFADLEFNCWKVGGFFAVCNANIEDSDIDLAAELVTALGQAIGLALDKAILYGTGTRMPQGIVTRLVQTTMPSDYPGTARTWQNLSTSNVISIADTYQDAALFKQLAIASGASKGAYARGEKVWVMNETTYTNLIANAMSIDASGAIVSGVNGTMPVIGGVIEVLNFIPDNVIIGGYFDLYMLVERAGTRFATSEHYRFLSDQTVFKGTARYDGKPAIAEAFVAIGIGGVTPNATMTFAPDEANTETGGEG